MLPTNQRNMAWRPYDRPMPGTIYRMLDDTALLRGITYTIMPDGRSLRVPAMNRLDVRAHADSHNNDEQTDIVQALRDIMQGKKPVEGRARFNRHGQAHGNRVEHDPQRGRIRAAPPPYDAHEGLRPGAINA